MLKLLCLEINYELLTFEIVALKKIKTLLEDHVTYSGVLRHIVKVSDKEISFVDKNGL